MSSSSKYLTALKQGLGFPDASAGEAAAYERAFWYYECIEGLKSLIKNLQSLLDDEVSEIEELGLTSDLYEVEEVTRQTSHVNVELMRERYPQEFAELVYVKNSDCGKIIGRRRLYELALAERGADGISKFERVNVEDVMRRMVESDADEIIETEVKRVGWRVLEKNTS